MCPGLLTDDEVLRAREILAREPSLGDFLPHKFYGRTLESTNSWLRALEMFSLFQSARRARAWAEEIELDEPGDWLAPERTDTPEEEL